jgi:signal transduction histidine kinase
LLPLDIVLALAVGLFVALTAPQVGSAVGTGEASRLDATGYLLVLATAAALVVRRRYPDLALAVAATATFTFVLLGYPDGPIYLGVMIAMYSVAVARTTRHAVAWAIALAVTYLVWLVIVMGQWTDALDTLGWLGAPLGLGVAVRTHGEARVRAVAHDRRRQVYEERLRIAQEVHDVVGHGLAMISINAGVALHILAKQESPQPQLEATLRAIRQAGNGALDELRATLATYTGQVAPPDERPPPGLAALADLVSATAVDGLRVRLDVTGTPNGIPSTVDITGYRIAQEALTNVVRHARAEHATIRVEYGPHQIQLRITDDGRGGKPLNPAGSGLASMGERARAVGGTLSAGPAEGGGFEVRAVLPFGGGGEAVE